jgi:hypothetical protein
MKIKYLVLVIAIVLSLIVIGPVSAYSIKVSTINSNGGISPTMQSYPNRIHTTRYVPSNSLDIPLASGTNANGSGGSVSAFSNGKFEDPTTFIEFGQSVSVNGVIKDFSYSARYDSGVFR